MASQEGHVDVITTLLDRGAELDACDEVKILRERERERDPIYDDIC
jgi:hypothetical protein